MGFLRFHKSFSLIPGVRINLSKSGPSLSFGPRGLHYTIGPAGSRTTLGIPGTGLSWTSSHSSSRGSKGNSRRPIVPMVSPIEEGGIVTLIQSVPIETLAASSTNEIASNISKNLAAWQNIKFLLNSAAIALIVLIFFVSKSAFLIFGAVVAWFVATGYARQSRVSVLNYELSDESKQKFSQLTRAFEELSACARVWQVPLEKAQSDWKRNAGATNELKRQIVSLGQGLPELISCELSFPYIQLNNGSLYFAPDALLFVSGSSIAALPYSEATISVSPQRFIEDEAVPADTKTIDYTWKFVNKDGGPDKRFSNNVRLPVCLYGKIDFRSSGGLNERILCSNADVSHRFVASLNEMKEVQNESKRRFNLVASHFSADDEERQRRTQLDLNVAFAHENETVQKLARDHDEYWQLLLVEALLDSRLEALKQLRSEIDGILKGSDKIKIEAREFLDWFGSALKIQASIIEDISECIRVDLLTSVSEPEDTGNPVNILNAVDKLFSLLQFFPKFEFESEAHEAPSAFDGLKTALRGIGSYAVDFAQQIKEEWSRNVSNIKSGSKEFHLNITFTTPPQIAALQKEISNLNGRQDIFLSPQGNSEPLAPPHNEVTLPQSSLTPSRDQSPGQWSFYKFAGIALIGFITFGLFSRGQGPTTSTQPNVPDERRTNQVAPNDVLAPNTVSSPNLPSSIIAPQIDTVTPSNSQSISDLEKRFESSEWLSYDERRLISKAGYNYQKWNALTPAEKAKVLGGTVATQSNSKKVKREKSQR